MKDESDAALVAAVRGGNREAAARLVERYLRACRAVALAVVRNPAAADDVSQDAFVYAIERIDDLREPARFGPWLMQIVRSRGRNHLRDDPAERASDIDQHPLAARGPLPDRAAETAEIRERLLTALRGIPEERSTVLLLHDLEGWTHQEIAERMELPPGTVRSHLHHARRRLRELLRDFKE